MMRMFALAAVTAGLLLSGCGGSTSGAGHDSMTTAPAGASFNDADVTFAQSMIPHHRQAVQMAALADGRAARAEVKTLAGKIKAAQQPEIDTMNGWLTAWGRPTDMSGMGMTMPGMMTDADMKKLMNAKGAGFDKQFLTMMISHHEGAIAMAQQEAAQGTNADAVALAKKVVTDQRAEIAKMRQMLADS